MRRRKAAGKSSGTKFGQKLWGTKPGRTSAQGSCHTKCMAASPIFNVQLLLTPSCMNLTSPPPPRPRIDIPGVANSTRGDNDFSLIFSLAEHRQRQEAREQSNRTSCCIFSTSRVRLGHLARDFSPISLRAKSIQRFSLAQPHSQHWRSMCSRGSQDGQSVPAAPIASVPTRS